MKFLKGIKVPAGDAAALSQQGCEIVRSGAEGLGLLQQHRMASERLAVGRPKRHGITLRADLFT